MSSARRGVLAIVGGTAGGQLLALACAPIISRLVPPHEYGPFAVVNAAIIALSTVGALRLDLAIPVPDDDDEALDVARLGLTVASVLGLVLTPVAWCARGSVAGALRLDVDPSLLFWIPLTASLAGAFTVLNQLAIRRRMYAAIARRSLVQAAAVSLLQVAAAALHGGAHGLAFGLAAGQALGIATLVRALRSEGAGARERSSAPLRTTLVRYRSFPLLLAPSGLVNSLGLQAPVLILASLYGTTVSGWLGMTQRVLGLPLALVGVALAQVYVGEFGAARRARSPVLLGLFLRTSARLLAAGLAMGAVLVVLAPWVFTTVLGAQWRVSGEYARVMAVGLVAQLVAAPLSQTVVVMGKVAWQAGWDLSRLVLCAGVVVLGHQLAWPASTTVAALGAAWALSYALLWVLSWLALCAADARPGC
ncbi:lipopolysaccharide biosynthesis protein [Arsenicicoccus dermatophilus]|uniref:lipopolysaccharide biosynthesis protein n=1 Tax=Arsenicicoccus dermatophilus TaxID=1076331 RepID=UPI00391729EF